MNRVDASAARSSFAKMLEQAAEEAVLIERYGKPAGVLLSPERYEELLEALEELEDIRAFDAAMAEEGENLPWEQVKAELGWS
ncbi:MAG: type II toxin-antitoxin system Phd/YefM family antitoxin [Trueperaceae bacterium]